MAMSDCERCWETPCICGWSYRIYTIGWLEKQKKMLEKVILFRKKFPDAEFSDYCENVTKDDTKFRAFMKT